MSKKFVLKIFRLYFFSSSLQEQTSDVYSEFLFTLIHKIQWSVAQIMHYPTQVLHVFTYATALNKSDGLYENLQTFSQ